MYTALTPSCFQCSMTLSSCDWAAVVSTDVPSELIVSTPAVPVGMPSFCSSGLIASLIRDFVPLSARIPTFLSFNSPCLFATSSKVRVVRSESVSVVSNSPPGLTFFMIDSDSSCVTSTVLCCLVTHSCAAPVGSYSNPITA